MRHRHALIMITISMTLIPGAYANEQPSNSTKAWGEEWKKWWDEWGDGILIPSSLVASIATMVFVVLLYFQLRNQKKEHKLTLRPIIVNDKDEPVSSITLTENHIEIKMINVSNIPAAKTRIILLPLDKHAEFLTRERALKEYLKKLGSNKLKKTDSCILFRPIRERMKRASEHKSFVNYLILGNDHKKLDPMIKKFKDMLDRLGDDEKQKRFDEAGTERAESLAKLSPTEWDKFYLVGEKHGDLLDEIGPVDWEVFDTDIGRDKMRELLGEFADEVYDTAPDRKAILDKMSVEDREKYDKAINKRLGVWDKFPEEVAKEYAKTSMMVRKTYKDVKDVKSTTYNIIAPNHPIRIYIDLTKKDKDYIKNDEYVYFGVLVQYSRPGEKEMEYTYYLQGYVQDNMAHLDHTRDTLE